MGVGISLKSNRVTVLSELIKFILKVLDQPVKIFFYELIALKIINNSNYNMTWYGSLLDNFRKLTLRLN